ncbi:putative 1,3-beta-glucan synthase [Helianthus anomalus]
MLPSVLGLFWILTRFDEGYKASETGQYLEQVIYKIKLPGPAILGEGKLENQNHAIIFTRGEGL